MVITSTSSFVRHFGVYRYEYEYFGILIFCTQIYKTKRKRPPRHLHMLRIPGKNEKTNIRIHLKTIQPNQDLMSYLLNSSCQFDCIYFLRSTQKSVQRKLTIWYNENMIRIVMIF